jgi:hypothetical protein
MSVYKAKQNISLPAGAFDTGKWELVSPGIDHYYKSGSIILHNNIYYKVKANNSVNPFSFDASKCDKIQQFNPLKSFNQGDYVMYGNKLKQLTQPYTPIVRYKLTLPESVVMYDANNPSAYIAGNIIYKDNQVYIATQNITAGSAWDSSKWKLLPGSFDIQTSYVIDDIVYYNDKFYKAVFNISAGIWDLSKWKLLPSLFDPKKSYVTNDIVYYDDKFYKAKQNISVENWNSSKWQLMYNLPNLFDPETSYEINDLVRYNGVIYKALQAVEGSTDAPSTAPNLDFDSWRSQGSVLDGYTGDEIIVNKGLDSSDRAIGDLFYYDNKVWLKHSTDEASLYESMIMWQGNVVAELNSSNSQDVNTTIWRII